MILFAGVHKVFWPVAILVVAILFCCFYASRVDFSDRNVSGNDSNDYVRLAMSLHATGEYKSTWIPSQPQHVKFPPGFPLVLTFFSSDNGFNAPDARALMVVLSALAVYLSFYIFRSASNLTALAVAVLTGQNMLLYLYGRSILSEIPYLVLSLMAFFLWERYEKANFKGIGLQFCLAAVLVSAFLMRTVGFFLIIAVLARLWLVSSRESSRVSGQRFIFLIPVALATGWWLFRQAGTGSAADPSYLHSLLQNRTGANHLFFVLDTWLRGLYSEIFYAIPQVLANVHFHSRSFFAYMLTAVFLIGLLRELVSQRSVLSIYLTLYLLGIAAWSWTQTSGARFMTPLVPFLIYFFLQGIYTLGKLKNIIRWFAIGLALFAGGVYVIHGIFVPPWISSMVDQVLGSFVWMTH